MNQIICDCCGESHDAENMDIAIKKPISYFEIKESELEKLILHESDDFIVIDNKIFLVRGILPIPIHEHDDFCWGLWAKVSEQTFADIWHMFESDGTGLIYDGTLDGAPKGYKDTYSQKVEIHLGTTDERPKFKFKENSCRMANEQLNGLSLHEISQIRESILK
ncbi:MAG: DUF2199 domain-containing protein [Alcanivoracaceae bacterium]|nr:DUF2199 domain-containing protein [Alcanivoracaceae bacterium]